MAHPLLLSILFLGKNGEIWEATVSAGAVLGHHGLPHILHPPKPQIRQGDTGLFQKTFRRRHRQGLDSLEVPPAVGFGELPLGKYPCRSCHCVTGKSTLRSRT